MQSGASKRHVRNLSYSEKSRFKVIDLKDLFCSDLFCSCQVHDCLLQMSDLDFRSPASVADNLGPSATPSRPAGAPAACREYLDVGRCIVVGIILAGDIL